MYIPSVDINSVKLDLTRALSSLSSLGFSNSGCNDLKSMTASALSMCKAKYKFKELEFWRIINTMLEFW